MLLWKTIIRKLIQTKTNKILNIDIFALNLKRLNNEF